MISPLQFYKRNFLAIDEIIVIILVIVFTVWVFCFGGETIVVGLLNCNRANLYRTAAPIFASLLGFSITATSIILGFSSSSRLAVLRNSRHYSTLWKIFKSTIWSLAVVTVCALVCLVWDRDDTPLLYLTIIFIYLVLRVLFRMGRVLWVLEKIIELIAVSPSEGETAQT